MARRGGHYWGFYSISSMTVSNLSYSLSLLQFKTSVFGKRISSIQARETSYRRFVERFVSPSLSRVEALSAFILLTHKTLASTAPAVMSQFQSGWVSGRVRRGGETARQVLVLPPGQEALGVHSASGVHSCDSSAPITAETLPRIMLHT